MASFVGAVDMNRWCNDLEHMAINIEILSPDTIEIMKGFFSDTRIQIPIIQVMDHLRNAQFNDPDEKFYRTCTELQKQFAKQLRERIHLIKKECGANVNDPWSRLAAKTDSNREALITASGHFQDLFLLCQTLAKYRITIEKTTCRTCVTEFQTKLKAYVDLLKQDQSLSQKVEELYNKMHSQLKRLTSALENPEETEKVLEEIEKEAKLT